MIFFVLGGDARQVYLAHALEEDGHTVLRWGLGQPREASVGCINMADCVVLPLPVSRDGHTVHLPLAHETLRLDELWTQLGKGLVCGGAVSNAVAAEAKQHGVELVDYYAREEVKVDHALATAEGAIELAIANTDSTIRGSRVLVLGYGRIGKFLAHHLHALGAHVTVAARRESQRRWAESAGCQVCPFDTPEAALGESEIVFNTVPAPVLTAQRLHLLLADCLVMELASAPGGVDSAAAKNSGVRLITAQGLPGKVAPRYAALSLRRAIYHILTERGELL